MPIDSHLPQADPFSLVPTFNEKIALISSFFGRRLVFAGAHLFDEKIR
jgi:hypothetical protein